MKDWTEMTPGDKMHLYNQSGTFRIPLNIQRQLTQNEPCIFYTATLIYNT